MSAGTRVAGPGGEGDIGVTVSGEVRVGSVLCRAVVTWKHDAF